MLIGVNDGVLQSVESSMAMSPIQLKPSSRKLAQTIVSPPGHQKHLNNPFNRNQKQTCEAYTLKKDVKPSTGLYNRRSERAIKGGLDFNKVTKRVTINLISELKELENIDYETRNANAMNNTQ